MDEAEVVCGEVFVASENAPEVLKPGTEALHFPAAAIVALDSAILRGGLLASPAMRRDYLDALLCGSRIQQIAVVSLVADQPCRSLSNETRSESCV